MWRLLDMIKQKHRKWNPHLILRILLLNPLHTILSRLHALVPFRQLRQAVSQSESCMFPIVNKLKHLSFLCTPTNSTFRVNNVGMIFEKHDKASRGSKGTKVFLFNRNLIEISRISRR